MAVSGRKVSDFQGSLSLGSAEDFEHYCDPCLTEGQHVEAQGYCVNCSEYLCSNCFRVHKKTKVSRHHQLLDKDNMDKHSTLPKPIEVCTEKCSVHKIEVIKFFCPKHEDLGCNDCMTMNHRTCKLDYIPDKCAGIGDSAEYREMIKELDQKMKEADAVLKMAAVKDKEIDQSHDKVIKDIARLRKDINDHLDTVQKKIEAEANKKKATSKQEVKSVVTSCTKFTSNIKKLKSSLQNSKAADQNGQIFIDIKRAKSELQSGEIQQAENVLGKTSTQFTFDRNRDVENILATDILGKLTERKIAADPPSKALQTLAATPKNVTFDSLQHKTDVKLGSFCKVTGCVVLSSGKLVLTDYRFSELLVVNTEENVVTEMKKLDSQPRDIAVLPGDKIAVTVPDKKRILILTTSSKLSTDRSICVKGECYGIIYHQNCLYVLCWNPYSVHVLDMKGNIKNTISLDKTPFDVPNYIVMNQDHSRLYISNYGNSSIVSVTLQGEVSAVYKHEDLGRPCAMLVLDDGTLLVCCWNNTIHHVSADWQQGRKVIDASSYPNAICYSADRREVYIGGYGNELKAYSVIYKD